MSVVLKDGERFVEKLYFAVAQLGEYFSHVLPKVFQPSFFPNARLSHNYFFRKLDVSEQTSKECERGLFRCKSLDMCFRSRPGPVFEWIVKPIALIFSELFLAAAKCGFEVQNCCLTSSAEA